MNSILDVYVDTKLTYCLLLEVASSVGDVSERLRVRLKEVETILTELEKEPKILAYLAANDNEILVN